MFFCGSLKMNLFFVKRVIRKRNSKRFSLKEKGSLKKSKKKMIYKIVACLVYFFP